MKQFLYQIALGACLVGAQGAFGASVHLIPNQQTEVEIGQEIGFEIIFDFADIYDSGSGVLGGGFDIVWDSAALDFSGIEYNIIGTPAFFREPDILPGLLESWTHADFFGLPFSGSFGTVYFTVVPGMGTTTEVFVRDTSGVGGPWLCDGVSLCIVDMDYNSVTLSRVPLPGAFVCLFGALAVLRLAALRQ